MVELTAVTPCEGLLPVVIGRVSLTEFSPGPITSLMVRQGQEKAAAAALKKAHSLSFPAPCRATGKAGKRVIWMGLGQVFLLGVEPAKTLEKPCALSQQSDGWAVMELRGADARVVLGRLCPLDLRPEVFKRSHSARSLVGHMNASITRTGVDTYLVMVFRSMAGTACHELSEAMKSVAALDTLPE